MMGRPMMPRRNPLADALRQGQTQGSSGQMNGRPTMPDPTAMMFGPLGMTPDDEPLEEMMEGEGMQSEGEEMNELRQYGRAGTPDYGMMTGRMPRGY